MSAPVRPTALSPFALESPATVTVHPFSVYLDSLSPGSRPTMQQALNAIAHLLSEGQLDALTFDWSKVRYAHAAAVRSALARTRSPATANKMLCALRRVLKEAQRLDLISAEDYAKATDLPPVRGKKQQPRGRALSQEEIAALIEVCLREATAAGARDAALIALLRGAGLRRAEVVSLCLRDFDPHKGSVEVRSGKGNSSRLTYLSQSAVTLVSDWLKLRGQQSGALLYPIRKDGKFLRRHMTPQAVFLILKKRAFQAGVESFSPHDFRRTFCSDLLDSGVDIVTVQKLAGHASVATTAKYDRRGEELKRAAVELLPIPLPGGMMEGDF